MYASSLPLGFITGDASIFIHRSVGSRGVNSPEDVGIVAARLLALGFDWAVPGPGGACTPEVIAAIELFQAVTEGVDVVRHTRVDGRVDVNGATLRWLGAANAPRWEALSSGGSPDAALGFCTSWLNEVLESAVLAYEGGYRRAHPGAAPLTVGDASPERGGNAPPHRGHQTGLACDLRLPHRNGTAGGLRTSSVHYDRAAMRAQLAALAQHPCLQFVFLDDEQLIEEGLCRPLAGHDDHAHVEIGAPARL